MIKSLLFLLFSISLLPITTPRMKVTESTSEDIITTAQDEPEIAAVMFLPYDRVCCWLNLYNVIAHRSHKALLNHLVEAILKVIAILFLVPELLQWFNGVPSFQEKMERVG